MAAPHRKRRGSDRVRPLRPAPRQATALEQAALPAEQAVPIAVLVAGGRQDEGERVAGVLAAAGLPVRVTHACDRAEILQAIGERPWDALIAGRGSTAADVRWLVGLLRDRSLSAPCIVLGESPEAAAALEAVQAGAADWVDLAGDGWARILPALERAAHLAEEQGARRRAEARWAEADRLYRLLAESAGDLVCLHRPEGGCVFASPSAAWLLGRTPEDLQGTGFLDAVHPEDASRVQAGLRRAAGGEDAVSVTHRMRRRPGDDVWMQTLAQAAAPGLAPAGCVQTISRDVSERHALQEQLAHLALHDALTGLPNRALFMDRLSHALTRLKRRKLTLAVLFFDIDGFQLINESLGRAAGDRLLAETAARLQAGLRPGDTVARVGGDEFTVLLDDVREPRDAARVADRVAESLAAPFPVDGIDVFITASVGIALAAARGELAEDVVRNADVAMLRAKQRGRGQQEIFTPEVHGAGSRPRLELEGDLRRALERGELAVHFQPVVSLGSGRLVGAEALVRWQHPLRGLLAPAAFLDVAEETGLIVPIGRWLLDAVCDHIAAWRARLGPEAVPAVGVNCSPAELASAQAAGQLAEVLAAHGLPPGAIRLEVRLDGLPDGAWTTLGGLAARGTPVDLDGFGGGATPLGDLGRIPLRSLPIDRGIVQALGEGPEAAAVARTVIALGHALGLSVRAEGVETDAQAAGLAALGCDEAQGHHFARPLPPDAFAALLASAPRWPTGRPA